MRPHVAIAGLALGGLSIFAPPGCKSGGREPGAGAAPPPRAARPELDAPAEPGHARGLLATLPVREAVPHRGYTREAFGHPWADVDRNGCDTRDDVLRRDLADARVEPGTRDCVVARGHLRDPYTGLRIDYERGRGPGIDIDHVVALGDAWSTGAAEWEPRKRLALANDPLNLLAVDASTNRAKGDRDAGAWLPPERAGWCAYVARQIAVKAKYGLWVTASERDAMARVLSECPDERAPAGDAPTLAPAELAGAQPADGPARVPKPEPAPAPKPAGTDPNYGTCKEARAHGAGPYYRDRDPEYGYYRDRDGDGVVCE